MEVRLSRSTLVGIVTIAFLGGLAIGTALVAWQRLVLLGRVSEAEQRMEDARKQTLGNTDELRVLRLSLDSAESSVTALQARNSKLASDLADAKGTGDGEQPAASSGSVTIVSRGVTPATVEGGKPITLTAKVKGKPDKVKMRLVARSGGYDKTFTLSRVSSSSGTQTWRATVNAPGDAGEYRYYASAWSGSKKYQMPGVSGWTFLVQ